MDKKERIFEAAHEILGEQGFYGLSIAAVAKIARDMDRDQIILANLCGRGDKDIFTVAKHLGFDMKI